MQVRQVICPSCRITLQVPAVYAGVVVRCSKCKGKFRLPKPSKVSEDTITSWLSEGLTPRHLDDDDLDAPPRKAAVAGERPTDTSEESAVMIAPPPADTVIEPVRLVKFGDSGALMEFQASRLREVEFRTAMPRRCLRCGTPAHLLAHVIIYSAQLVDNVSLEAEHAAGELRLAEDQTRNLNPEQLLQRLPVVPNVPAPEICRCLIGSATCAAGPD